MSLTHIIYFLAATVIIPSAIGIVRYRKLPSSLKFITLLLIIGTLTEGVMISLSTQKVNNLFAVHFYALAEIILLSLYFHYQIQSVVVRKVIITVMISLSAFALVYAFTGNNIAQFNSVPRAIECVYFSILSYWLFYEMSDSSRPVNEYEYYINGTIMFYFSSCFIIFAFNKYLVSNQNMIITMVKAHAYINAFCNLTYAAGLWIASKQYYARS